MKFIGAFVFVFLVIFSIEMVNAQDFPILWAKRAAKLCKKLGNSYEAAHCDTFEEMVQDFMDSTAIRYLEQIGMYSISREVFEKGEEPVWKQEAMDILTDLWKWIKDQRLVSHRGFAKVELIKKQLQEVFLPWILKIATDADASGARDPMRVRRMDFFLFVIFCSFMFVFDSFLFFFSS